jgi:hypothetical protein
VCRLGFSAAMSNFKVRGRDEMARAARQRRSGFHTIVSGAIVFLLLFGNLALTTIYALPGETPRSAGSALSISSNGETCSSKDASTPGRGHHHENTQCCSYCTPARRDFSDEFNAIQVEFRIFSLPRMASSCSYPPIDEFDERPSALARSHRSRAPPIVS